MRLCVCRAVVSSVLLRLCFREVVVVVVVAVRRRLAVVVVLTCLRCGCKRPWLGNWLRGNWLRGGYPRPVAELQSPVVVRPYDIDTVALLSTLQLGAIIEFSAVQRTRPHTWPTNTKHTQIIHKAHTKHKSQ